MSYSFKKQLLCFTLILVLLVTLISCNAEIPTTKPENEPIEEIVLQEKENKKEVIPPLVDKQEEPKPEPNLKDAEPSDEPYMPDDPSAFTFYWVTDWDKENPILLPNPYPIEGAFTGEILKKILIPFGYMSMHSQEVPQITVNGEIVSVKVGEGGGFNKNVYLSIKETLLRNCSSIKEVRFYGWDGERWNNQTFSPPAYTSEELFELQKSIPMQYISIDFTDEKHWISKEQQELFWVSKDAQTVEFREYLAKIHFHNLPRESFYSPSEMPTYFALESAMHNVMGYTVKDEKNLKDIDLIYEPDLLPLGETSGMYQFLLQTHLEIAAKELLGEAATLTFEDVPYLGHYIPYAGVVSQCGQSLADIPVVLDYTKNGNIFTIQVVFMHPSFPDGGLKDTNGNLLTRETIESYYDSLVHYTITLEKRESGGFNYLSFVM